MKLRTSKERSRIMAAVPRSNTVPEVRLRWQLALMGLRCSGTKSTLPGTPDLVFVSAKVAVFVDGCFWHGCPVHGTRPKTNRKFWDEKITRNRTRDRRVDRALRKAGWCALRIWEHDIRGDVERSALRVAAAVFDRTY